MHPFTKAALVTCFCMGSSAGGIACGGGSGDPLPGREAFPGRPLASACFVALDAEENANPPPVTEFVGEVVEAGRGEPPEACFTGWHSALFGRVVADEALMLVEWVRLEVEDGREFLVGLLLPDTPPSLEIGDRLSVRLRFEPFVFSPGNLSLALVRQRDGRTVWLTQQVGEDDLVPEVRIEQGAVVGVTGRDCNPVGLHAIDVSRRGEDVTVPFHGDGELEDLRVFHLGAYSSRRPPGMSCFPADFSPGAEFNALVLRP